MIPLQFSRVNIETYGYCNRKCPWCFYVDGFPKRKQGIMEEWVWRKIIDELAELSYGGRLTPAFYGEPLLDKRLPKLIRYARKKLDCRIHITTNGDYLTKKLLLTLIKNGASYFRVTQYDEKPNCKIEKLAEEYPEYIRYLHYKTDTKQLRDRYGFILKHKLNKQIVCNQPVTRLFINWEGDVLLCCSDFYATHRFGNVKNEKIWTIWNNTEHLKIQQLLWKGERSKIEPCKYCDRL